MARAPRASVPKTTGQGVSRLGYQKGYKLRNPGGPKIKASASIGTDEKKPRNYGKGYKAGETDLNISFGDTLRIADLPETPPKSGVKNELAKSLKLK